MQRMHWKEAGQEREMSVRGLVWFPRQGKKVV